MALEIIGEMLKLTVFAGLALAGIIVILIWMKDLTRKVTYLRIFIQIVSVVAIYYLFTYPIWLVVVLGAILFMTLVHRTFLLRLDLPVWPVHRFNHPTPQGLQNTLPKPF